MPNWSNPELQWDERNIDHIIERHDVQPDEADQVFMGRRQFRRVGDVYYVLGQTFEGRKLFLVCVIRGDKIRVISARPMNDKEKRSYGRK